MKKTFFCCFAFVVLLSSCKKDNDSNQPFSTWVIGTDSFSTNNLEYFNSSKAGTSINWNSNGSSAGYYTILTHLPDDGEKLLYTGRTGQNPAYLDVSFSLGNVGYIAQDTNARISISNSNGAFVIHLPPTLFRKVSDSLVLTMISANLVYRQ